MEKTKNRFRDLSEKILIFALGIIFFGGVFAAWNDIKTSTDILTAQDWNDLVANIGGGGSWTVSGDDVYRETGNVGIGTTVPESKLHIYESGSTGIRIQDTSGAGNLLDIRVNSSSVDFRRQGSTLPMTFTMGSNERMRINDSGVVNVTGDIEASGTVCDSNGCIGSGGGGGTMLSCPADMTLVPAGVGYNPFCIDTDYTNVDTVNSWPRAMKECNADNKRICFANEIYNACESGSVTGIEANQHWAGEAEAWADCGSGYGCASTKGGSGSCSTSGWIPADTGSIAHRCCTN